MVAAEMVSEMKTKEHRWNIQGICGTVRKRGTSSVRLKCGP